MPRSAGRGSVLKYVDEYRDGRASRAFGMAIRSLATRTWTIMEVCGGQTHSIMKHSLESLLPPLVTLIHGPGCPVCVTPAGVIDSAIELAALPAVTLCSFGDMLRVPGSSTDLLRARAAGGDVRTVYSPFDAVEIAASLPDRQVVFFAVGFETTAPVTATALLRARDSGLSNFSMLVSHLLVPPALEAVLSMPSCRIQGLLAPGHVCSITGYEQYEPIASRHGIPIVVTGFEPLDILQGIHMCLAQLEAGRSSVENQYTRSVTREGNVTARKVMAEVFRTVDRAWRGLGPIASSGLELAPAFAAFDARRRFDLAEKDPVVRSTCLSGRILTGEMKPVDCPEFRAGCSPDTPLGAPMVSSEGACAAYYRYGKGRRDGNA